MNRGEIWLINLELFEEWVSFHQNNCEESSLLWQKF